MSTILDALRKVAEDQHTHGVDVRTRLLSFPSRLDTRARRRPSMVWFVSAAVAITGFSAGAGLMYWRSRLPVQEEQSTTLARSTLDAPPTVARAPLAIPSTTAENQPPPRAPDLPQSTPPTAPPIPSTSAAPAQPLPMTGVQDRFSSAPAPTSSSRAIQQPRVSPSTKEAKRTVPLPAPASPRESPPMPAVRPELAIGNPPLVPSFPFVPPMQDAPDPGAPIEDPAAEILPLPDTMFGVPPVETLPPTQLPPVADEANTVQADVSLSFLQWSPEGDKRMAFLRVRGGPLTMAQEGDNVGGFTVTEISPDAVTLRSGDKTWVLQVR